MTSCIVFCNKHLQLHLSPKPSLDFSYLVLSFWANLSLVVLAKLFLENKKRVFYILYLILFPDISKQWISCPEKYKGAKKYVFAIVLSSSMPKNLETVNAVRRVRSFFGGGVHFKLERTSLKYISLYNTEGAPFSTEKRNIFLCT